MSDHSSMSLWSTEHNHQIIERFWQRGTASCPDDGGSMKLKLHKLFGGDYRLMAERLVCGKAPRHFGAGMIPGDQASGPGRFGN